MIHTGPVTSQAVFDSIRTTAERLGELAKSAPTATNRRPVKPWAVNVALVAQDGRDELDRLDASTVAPYDGEGEKVEASSLLDSAALLAHLLTTPNPALPQGHDVYRVAGAIVGLWLSLMGAVERTPAILVR
jgi:hypothetical protein